MKKLAGSFTLLVAGPGFQDQITFHHPIGPTDEPGDVFVATPTGEVATLLAGAEDPHEQRLAREETKVFLELLVSEGLLFTDGNGRHYYAKTQICRETELDLASHKLEEEKKRLNAEHDAAQKGKAKAKKFRHNLTRNMFLPPEVQAFEKTLAEKRRELRDKIHEKVPRTYRNLGGPLRDKPQTACLAIPRGTPLAEAQKMIFKSIAQPVLKGIEPGKDGAAETQNLVQARDRALAEKAASIETQGKLQKEITRLRKEVLDFQTQVAELQSKIRKLDAMNHDPLRANPELTPRKGPVTSAAKSDPKEWADQHSQPPTSDDEEEEEPEDVKALKTVLATFDDPDVQNAVAVLDEGPEKEKLKEDIRTGQKSKYFVVNTIKRLIGR